MREMRREEKQPRYTLIRPHTEDGVYSLTYGFGKFFLIEFLDFKPEVAEQVLDGLYLYKGYLVSTKEHSREHLWFLKDGNPVHCLYDIPPKFELNGRKYWWYRMDFKATFLNPRQVRFVDFGDEED